MWGGYRQPTLWIPSVKENANHRNLKKKKMQNTERLTSGTNNADLVPVAFWMAVRMSSSVRSSHGSTSCKTDQIARDTRSISDCKPALHFSYQNRIHLSTYGIKLPHSWTIILFNKMVRGPLRLHLKSSGYLKLQLFKEMRSLVRLITITLIIIAKTILTVRILKWQSSKLDCRM